LGKIYSYHTIYDYLDIGNIVSYEKAINIARNTKMISS